MGGLGRPWEASGLESELERTGALGGLGRPQALGASWSKLEPREASGGLGRPQALGVSWSKLEQAGARCEVRGASHLVKLSLPDIFFKSFEKTRDNFKNVSI